MNTVVADAIYLLMFTVGVRMAIVSAVLSHSSDPKEVLRKFWLGVGLVYLTVISVKVIVTFEALR